MKVYVVTHGCYSDYGISHVFATREAAQALLDDYKARAERAAGVQPSPAHGAYSDYGDYNLEIDEWEVLTEPPSLYEHWRATWTADSGLSRYGPRSGEEGVEVYCGTICPQPSYNEDSDPPVVDASDYYHFCMEPPPGTVGAYRSPGRPPPRVYGDGRSPEAAQKAMYDKLAFLRAVAEGIA